MAKNAQALAQNDHGSDSDESKNDPEKVKRRKGIS